MTGQQLKNSILQMAVQGKLVPQDPNDEPASVLLERIRKEKEQLIKEGKIKKEKNPSYIFRSADNLPYEKVGKNEPVCIADEVPFEIPDSWEWARLGMISTYSHTKQKINAKNADPTMWGLDLEDIEKGGRLLDRKTVGERKAVGDKTFFDSGDILYSKLRPYLLKILVAPDCGICTPEIVPFKVFGNLDPKYIVAFLKCPYVAAVINAVTYGVKMPRVGTETMTELLVPIPPLSEQKRIVEKLNEVTPLTDNYTEAYIRAVELNQEFPELLKKSILQEAVQGKLVPQDPADEPASVLLERIRAEKEQLIKAGKIKRDKHESVIFRRDNSHYEKLDGIERCIDDKIPFEIPDSWAWTSVREVCSDIQYGSSQKSSPTGKVAVLRMGNLQNGRIVLDKLVYTSDPKEIEKYLLEYNDLLFNRTNSKELVGKVAIYKSEIPAIYAGYLVRMHPILIDSDYLNYVMQSQYYWIYCQNVRSDAIGQSNINAEKLKRFIFPLPPLEEQKRIVNEISHIIAKLKNL